MASRILRTAALIATCLALAATASCANKAMEPMEGLPSAARAKSADAAGPELAAMALEEAFDEAAAPSPGEAPKDAVERKLIKSGRLELEVEGLAALAAAAQVYVASIGGYVESSSIDAYNVSLALRVPSARFEPAMDALEAFSGKGGRVLSRTASAEDVTERWMDLEGSVKNLKVLEERYRRYLTETKDIEEILQVERRLSELRREIEELEGELKGLGRLVSFSRIDLSASLPARLSPPAPGPGLGDRFASFFEGAGDFFAGLLVVLVGLVVFGVPLVLLAGLLWWLLFGKIGLLKRFFSRISSPKAPRAAKDGEAR